LDVDPVNGLTTNEKSCAKLICAVHLPAAGSLVGESISGRVSGLLTFRYLLFIRRFLTL
jgi:hypothetical protein